METAFENRYITTHVMLAEFMRKYAVGPQPKTVAGGMAAVAFITCIAWYEGVLVSVVKPLLLFLFLAAALNVLPEFAAWNKMRAARKRNAGIQPETRVVFGDAIEIQEGMTRSAIEYREIVDVVHLKHSYVLMMNSRSGVILDPAGFTRGSFETFKSFLREKYPHLAIPE